MSAPAKIPLISLPWATMDKRTNQCREATKPAHYPIHNNQVIIHATYQLVYILETDQQLGISRRPVKAAHLPTPTHLTYLSIYIDCPRYPSTQSGLDKLTLVGIQLLPELLGL